MIYLLALLLAVEMGASVWTARSVPRFDSEERVCANRSDDSWRVSVFQGRLVISQRTPGNDWSKLPSFLKPKRKKRLRKMIDSFTAIEVEDGFLVGNDVGEWGGWVNWYSEDGKRQYNILKGNPIGFAAVGDSIAVVEGLGHLGTREGSVRYLRVSETGRWNVWKTVDLEDVPYAFLTDADAGIVIVTSSGLVRVTEAGVRRVAEAVYEFLYPNSLAVVDNSYYVGMRYAVSELTPSTDSYSERWLVPADCPQLAKPTTGGMCQCVEVQDE